MSLFHKARRFLLRRLHGDSLELCLRDLFQTHHLDLVVDVGANRGQYAGGLRRQGYSGEILSFEPIPELARGISGDARWRVVAEAVGDANETRDLRIPMHTVLSSFRGPSLDATPGLLQKLSAERVIPVPVWRLETRLPQLVPDLARRRIHLKLDTQGFDLEALAGLGPIPIVSLQLELPFVRIYDGVPTAAEHFRILDGLGYDLVGVYPVVRHKTGVLVEADGVFLRR